MDNSFAGVAPSRNPNRVPPGGNPVVLSPLNVVSSSATEPIRSPLLADTSGLDPSASVRARGDQLLQLALSHISEHYVLGAHVPKDASDHRGPWDCAEFASWLVYQVNGLLYGCVNNTVAPAIADGYTGAWKRDAKRSGQIISVSEAARMVGAMVLRAPSDSRMGHIVVSDGNGGTVEAHSARRE